MVFKPNLSMNVTHTRHTAAHGLYSLSQARRSISSLELYHSIFLYVRKITAQSIALKRKLNKTDAESFIVP